MMRIYKGITLEKVIDLACDEENIDPQYLKYIILSQTEEETQIGCFFISDVIKFIEGYLESYLVNLDVKASYASKYEDEAITVNVTVPNNAFLVGQNGITLNAITKLVRNAVFNQFKTHFHLIIDINDYKANKYKKLISYAKKTASEVQKTHIKIQLYPMSSDERRLIHATLANYHHIKTESTGEGLNRCLVVKYDPDKV